MTRRWLGVLCLTAVASAGSGACGKRGEPLPPLRPVPARVTEVTAASVDDRVELRLTIPAANLDGSTPPAVDRVEVFGLGTAAGVTVPTADQIAADPKNLRLQLAVRREAAAPAPAAPPVAPPPAGVAGAAAPAADVRPEAGSAATMVDRLDRAALTTAGVTFMHYVVRGVTGSGRGRPGPWSAVLSVPVGALAVGAVSPRLAHDETTLTLSWTAPAEGLSYRVFEVTSAEAAAGAASAPTRLTPAPVPATEFKTPVEFGRARCFVVRPVRVTGNVMVDGSLSSPVCATPADTFPPAGPAELRVVQEGASITLIWSTVEAADLVGYRVLRGDGAEGVLRQLTADPVTVATYTDATARPGATYTYSVVAVDKAGNLSTQSNRQTVTVR